MNNKVFGWNYPAGAEHDPRAPWNQDNREVPAWRCPNCGKQDSVTPDDWDAEAKPVVPICEECDEYMEPVE